MSEIINVNHALPTTIDDLSKFVLVGREKLVAVRAEIRAIEKVGLAQEVRTQKLAEAQDIAEAVLDAEVKIGELMAKVPKATKGTGSNQYAKKAENDNAVDFCKSKADIIREAGLEQKQVERFQVLAEHPEIVEQAKAEARESQEVVTRSDVLSKIKKEQRKELIQRQVEEIEKGNIEKPDGLFDVIAIDPPWNYGTSFDADGRRVANPYPEMTQEQLKALEIPAKANCVMFLWTTQKFIWDAKELLDTWGFTYRSMIVWDKEKIGMGDLIRMQCEFCLVGIKGSPVFKDNHSVRDIIREPRREHSRKPEEFYRIVDDLCAGRKLDFFSREERTGWFSYGNDTKKF